MATISRVVKGNGTQAWEDGDNFPASEINGDLDAVLNGVNGNLDNGNLTALANIAVTKVGDNSADDATQNLTVTPGDSLSTSLPSDLKGEIERLRHRIKMNTAGSGLQARNAAGAMVDLAWTEPPPVGPNLFPNSGFETQSGGAGTAPDDWTLFGSPSTCVIQAASNDAAGKTKTSLNVIGDGISITYTLTGLKSNTKYRIGAAYERTADTFSITTSGGLGSATNYGDLNFSDNSETGLQYFNGVLKTDGSATNIVVNFIIGGTASAEVNIFNVWAQEMSDEFVGEQNDRSVIPFVSPLVVRDTANTAFATVTGGAPATRLYADLDLDITIPDTGYELEYRADFQGTGDDVANTEWIVNLEMDIDGGGWNTVDSKSFDTDWPGGAGLTTCVGQLVHYIETPVVSSVYSFRISWDDAPAVTMNSPTGGSSRATLRLRRK